jgi:hypothetical protein
MGRKRFPDKHNKLDKYSQFSKKKEKEMKG